MVESDQFDRPSGRHRKMEQPTAEQALQALEPLVGEWTVEAKGPDGQACLVKAGQLLSGIRQRRTWCSALSQACRALQTARRSLAVTPPTAPSSSFTATNEGSAGSTR